ncbi:MAG: hypothetical protein K2J77_06220 [Oscillospiraceae bacterium]|nr:hypothetical protein [Oscillospiraceae bacterium]
MKTFFFKHLRVFRVIAMIIAIAATAWLIWFGCALSGNPVSYFLVKSSSQKYVAENYPGFVAENPGYNFKFGNYFVRISKPGSDDSSFVASFGLNGRFLYDNYEGNVTNGYNTRLRLETRYRELVKSVLESPASPFETDIGFGELIFARDSDNEERYPAHDFSIPTDILEPDGIYDIAALGEIGGVLDICVCSEDKSPERAAEILRELDALMTKGGVTFRAIDLTLESSDREYYTAENIHREEISQNDLAEIVIQKHNAYEARFASIEK